MPPFKRRPIQVPTFVINSRQKIEFNKVMILFSCSFFIFLSFDIVQHCVYAIQAGPSVLSRLKGNMNAGRGK